MALKVIKPGMAARPSPALKQSAKHWTMMDHPNIAKVLDAGATDAGHPYFVMKLVRGVPIIGAASSGEIVGLQEKETLVAVTGVAPKQTTHVRAVLHAQSKFWNCSITARRRRACAC